MKNLILSTLSLLMTFCAAAQKENDSKINFNVGAELGLATGAFNITHFFAIGSTAQVEYAVDDKTSVTANSGIIQFSGRSIDAATKFSGITVIPILVGGKYYFSDNFFGTAQLGLSIFSGVFSSSKFTYAPGLGFMINDKIEALVKYTGYSNLGGAFGVRVAYNL